MDLETVVFSPDVAKDRLIRNSDNPKVCVVSRLGAEGERVEVSRPFAVIAFIIKFWIVRTTMNGMGFRIGNVLDKMLVEVIKVNLEILKLFTGLVDGEGDKRGDMADILDTKSSTWGSHFLSLTSSISDSSSLSEKEVQGVVLTGPVCGAILLTLTAAVSCFGVEQLGAVEQLMVTYLGGEGLVGCVWVGVVGVIVWNTSSRLSSTSLGELEMLAREETSELWSPISQVSDISHFLSLK